MVDDPDSPTLAPGPILLDSGNDWLRLPYQVTLGDDFNTMQEALAYYTSVKKSGEGTATGGLSELLGTGEKDVNPAYFTKAYFKDTRVGANDAINCLWQFNRDDDIVHPLTMTEPNGIGMGRVYSEMIEKNQQILWITAGIPEFTSLVDFYANAIDSSMSRMVNAGGFTEYHIGELFGKLGAIAISLPIQVFQSVYKFVTRIDRYKVNKYYDLRPQMHQYYKYIDSMCASSLVNMGFYGDGNWTASPESLPEALRRTGPGIWDILLRKALAAGNDTARNRNLDDEIKRIQSMSDDEFRESEWGLGTLAQSAWSTALGSTQFVGFRIDKNTDSSESFSNSTGPSSIAESMNSKIRDMRDSQFSFAKSADGNTITGFNTIDGFISGLASVYRGTMDAVNLGGLASAASGAAFLDFPDVWKESSFGKSYNFSMKLRAPYGDPVSVYQSIHIPLFMLLALALPRATGPNSYSSPFLIRAYCKGMFAIPMGMIDSISITRGAPEFGWNHQNIPTQVNVDFSIKDMSPLMYMSIIGNNMSDLNLFGSNSSFQEYLLTLSGVGLFERVTKWANIRRKAQTLGHIARNRYAHPGFWSNGFGDELGILKFIASFSPQNKLPHN